MIVNKTNKKTYIINDDLEEVRTEFILLSLLAIGAVINMFLYDFFTHLIKL